MSRLTTTLKFLSSKKIIIVLVVLILIVGIFYYSKTKTGGRKDGMSLGGGNFQSSPSETSATPAPYISPVQTVSPSDSTGGYSVQPIANPADLLPKDQNSQWTTLNPTINANNVILPDLLEAGYHIGLDTIGQTLRNANLQVRSDPIIPKQEVSPWNNSTIEPDLGRVPLELGYGCR